jgi:hypothetical protein
VPAVPSEANTLACLEQGHIRADGIHNARNLVPWNARIGDAGQEAELGDRIAMADAASLHADAHMPRSWLGKFFLH